MLRVRAIPGEPTRFWVTGNTLLCDNPACGKEYNRMTRHQAVLGVRQPTEYLRDGTPCPKCLARISKWRKRNKDPHGDEPALGVMRNNDRLVDIAGYSRNGSCSCPFFQCSEGMEKALKVKTSVEQAMGQHRCQHIVAARSFALDVALRVHEVERYAVHAHGQREERAA
jgi:hypothetical protein